MALQYHKINWLCIKVCLQQWIIPILMKHVLNLLSKEKVHSIMRSSIDNPFQRSGAKFVNCPITTPIFLLVWVMINKQSLTD